MPTYSTNWSDASPTASEQLAQGPADFATLEIAIQQRIESFFQSIDQDPLIPIVEIIKGASIAGGAITIDKLDPSLNIKSMLMVTAPISGTIHTFGTISVTVNVPGAEIGDFCFAAFAGGAIIAGPTYIESAVVTAAGVVTLVVRNFNLPLYVGPDAGGGPITITSAADPPSGGGSDVSPVTLTATQVNVLVIKVGTPGQLNAVKSPIIPASEFIPQDQTQSIGMSVTEIFPGYVGPVVVYASLALPAGTKVTGANLRCNSINTGAITGTLWQVNSVGGTSSLCTFTAGVGAGLQTLNQAFNYVVATGDIQTFQITLDSTGSLNANDARLDWAQILTG